MEVYNEYTITDGLGGDVTISGDLTYDPNTQTLTCISAGGPATTVQWTRDSTPVTEGTETVLNDPVTARYTHTLTLTGRLPGLYTCIVVNNKPSADSANILGALHYTINAMTHKITFCLQQVPCNFQM